MLELDAESKEALRRYRASRPEQSPLEATLDAVVLTSDLGGDLLLTLDGRLLQDSPFDGLGEIESVVMRRAALFLGAQRVPELARILPLRSENATVCGQCTSTGWLELSADYRIPCGRCGGMGWVDDEVRRELADKQWAASEPLPKGSRHGR